MKGGIVIPNIDFITSLLNVPASDVTKCDVRTDGDTVYYEITLVRKPMDCPVCGSLMIGHGHKARTIRHPAIRDYKGIILYHANRYICRACRKTAIEKNPFAFDGFNSSLFLLQSAMKLLGNLNYSLQMISDELQISATQLSRYLDSYVTIHPRPLPACLGIDEIHNRYLSKKIPATSASLLTMKKDISTMSLIPGTSMTCPCTFQGFQEHSDAGSDMSLSICGNHTGMSQRHISLMRPLPLTPSTS